MYNINADHGISSVNYSWFMLVGKKPSKTQKQPVPPFFSFFDFLLF